MNGFSGYSTRNLRNTRRIALNSEWLRVAPLQVSGFAWRKRARGAWNRLSACAVVHQ